MASTWAPAVPPAALSPDGEARALLEYAVEIARVTDNGSTSIILQDSVAVVITRYIPARCGQPTYRPSASPLAPSLILILLLRWIAAGICPGISAN